MWGDVRNWMDWLNRNEGAISVLLTCVVVALTIALILYTHRSDVHARSMLRSADLQRLNSTIPVIGIVIDGNALERHDRTTAAFPIEVRNAGAGPAIHPVFSWETKNTSKLEPGPSTVVIGAGATLEVWITHESYEEHILSEILESSAAAPGRHSESQSHHVIGTLRIDYIDSHIRAHWGEFTIGYTSPNTGAGYRPSVINSTIHLENDIVPRPH